MTSEEMRIARINRGMSIRGLARTIDVPEQSIRRLEAGNGISLPYAKKIADFYDLLVTDILPLEAAATA